MKTIIIDIDEGNEEKDGSLSYFLIKNGVEKTEIYSQEFTHLGKMDNGELFLQLGIEGLISCDQTLLVTKNKDVAFQAISKITD